MASARRCLGTAFAAWTVATVVGAAAPEVRGTWLTTTNEDQIRTGANTAAVMADLRTIGLNTVYVESWKNGYTNFPSTTLRSVIGVADRNPTIGATRDLTEETLIQAHRQGMAYYAWFEYGAMSQFVGAGGNPNNPLSNFMKARGWLLQNQAGQYADSTNGFAYMNVAVPEVRQIIVDLTLEAVRRYDLDGVQFDDHMAWPVNFGFDATTLALYQQQTGNPAPTSPTNSAFRQWRQQKVTEFAAQLYAAVKAERPQLQFSISPSITTFSTTNSNADWPAWESQGLFDEFAVQAYRDNIAAFNSIVNAQVNPFEPNDLDKLVFGLRINGTPAATPYADLQQMIERSRTEGAAGHSLWYGAGVRDLYRTQLTAFYDVAGQGPAVNPRFGGDWRPASLVASASGGGIWSASVATAGRYRLVARYGAATAPWSEIAAVELGVGPHDFSLASLAGATAVELLLDRREETAFLGDATGDGSVDGADLLAWQANLGAAVAQGAAGDADHDGVVAAADFPAWQLNFGRTPPIIQPTPEPATGVIAGAVLTLVATAGRCQGRLNKS